MALFPEKAQHEYWATDRTLSASSFAPFGRVTEVQGGLKLNGKWGFCSGIDHAQWMILAAFAGTLSEDPPIPDIRYCLVPKSDVKVVDDWYVLGLQGTGSKSCVVEDLFVPEHRTVTNFDLTEGKSPGSRLYDSPLYKTPVWAIFPFCISSVAPGIVKGAVEAFVGEMKVRASQFDHSPLSRKPTIRARLAEASALADAAELLYQRSLHETIDKIMRGERLSLERPAAARRRGGPSGWRRPGHAGCARGARGGGIFNHSHVQRCSRDLAGVAAHIAGNWDMPAVNYGQVILGGPPADPIF